MPEAQPLALLRADIDRNPNRLRRVLMDPRMRKEILKGAPNDEKRAVKAFAAQNSENALKTKPKVRRNSFPACHNCLFVVQRGLRDRRFRRGLCIRLRRVSMASRTRMTSFSGTPCKGTKELSRDGATVLVWPSVFAVIE